MLKDPKKCESSQEMMMSNPDDKRSQRVTNAILNLKKTDSALLERASGRE
jgi:hypothetical protein